MDHRSHYMRNSHLSPTLVTRLTNTIRIPSPRQSTFPRPMASVLDPIASFFRRFWAVLKLLDCGMHDIAIFLLCVALLTSALVALVALLTAPLAITEVEYVDCSAAGRFGEACTVVRVPASEYVLDPIVLFEPREHH